MKIPISKQQEFVTYGMSSLRPEDTGLELYVLVRPKPDAKHKIPSIKIRRGRGSFKGQDGVGIVAITEDPKFLNGSGDNIQVDAQEWAELVKWLLLNKHILLQYWNEFDSGMGTREMEDQLKKVQGKCYGKASKSV